MIVALYPCGSLLVKKTPPRHLREGICNNKSRQGCQPLFAEFCMMDALCSKNCHGNLLPRIQVRMCQLEDFLLICTFECAQILISYVSIQFGRLLRIFG